MKSVLCVLSIVAWVCISLAVNILVFSVLGIAQDKKSTDVELTRDEVTFLLAVLNPRPNESRFMIQGSEVETVVEIKASLRTLAAQDTSKKVYVLPLTTAQKALCLRAINLHQYNVALADPLFEFKKKFAAKK